MAESHALLIFFPGDYPDEERHFAIDAVYPSLEACDRAGDDIVAFPVQCVPAEVVGDTAGLGSVLALFVIAAVALGCGWLRRKLTSKA